VVTASPTAPEGVEWFIGLISEAGHGGHAHARQVVGSAPVPGARLFFPACSTVVRWVKVTLLEFAAVLGRGTSPLVPRLRPGNVVPRGSGLAGQYPQRTRGGLREGYNPRGRSLAEGHSQAGAWERGVEGTDHHRVNTSFFAAGKRAGRAGERRATTFGAFPLPDLRSPSGGTDHRQDRGDVGDWSVRIHELFEALHGAIISAKVTMTSSPPPGPPVG